MNETVTPLKPETTTKFVAAKTVASGVRVFRGYLPPLLLVGVLSLLLIASLLSLVAFTWSPLADNAWVMRLLDEARRERLLFLSYFLVLVAMWAIYFLSSYDWGTFKTLRQLLLLTSEIFGRDKVQEGDNNEDAIATALREKARNSITMLAMLTAAATLLFTRSLDVAYQPTLAHWPVALAYAGAGAALAAAICFVISVDSFDVMYNLFGAPNSIERAHMLQFFYNSTRNTRYYGVMFLLWAVCLFAAARTPLLGTFAVSLVVCMGWSHWFPSPPEVGATMNASAPVSLVSLILRAAFIALPFLWVLLDAQRGFFLTGD